MSFSTDLNYVMTNDSSLLSYCDGGILYENLPENFEITKDWIVYSFNKVSQKDCLFSKSAYTEYNIFVEIVSTDTYKVEVINDYIVKYLNNTTYNGIHDISFIGDSHASDLDRNLYINTLNFNALYL